MQGTRIHLIAGGLLLAVMSSGQVQAETLQPDPAWQQGKLENGFSWQLLNTPQRPSDRIELRLQVNTGSMAETAQQLGFAHLLPRLTLLHSASFTPVQLHSFWQQVMTQDAILPPAVTSYDFTQYNLSIPNNRPELLKDAITWLGDVSGNLVIDEDVVNRALSMTDPVVTFPLNPQDAWWRYRLKDSTLLGRDPGQAVVRPVHVEHLQQFYQQWYTPDAMTLYIVGNVDSRSISEQINKVFSGLTGKREAPTTMATLAPLQPQAVSLMSEQLKQGSLSLIWDTPWKPIRSSQALSRYWGSDLAREALFMHIQQTLKSNEQKNLNLRFDCRVQYQRSQCAIHLDTSSDNLQAGMSFIVRELASVRKQGLTAEEFSTLQKQKQEQLNQLFATYARTDTDILMSQRLRSQQSGVVDIAPEQYQKLRQEFLASLTLESLNQELRQLLSQRATLVVMQPTGEPEADVKALQELYDTLMAPLVSVPENTEEESGKTKVGEPEKPAAAITPAVVTPEAAIQP